MMFTFLTGRPPFDTEGVRNTLNKVVLAEFEMPGYLSPEAQDLVACLLKKNPMERMPLAKVREHPFMTNVRAAQHHKMLPASRDR
jgi:polo-like kinase 4